MVEVQDDVKYFSVTVTTPPPPEGQARIDNIVAPTQVQQGEPFNVTYDCHNDGGADELYGFIFDTDAQAEMPGTRWVETIDGGAVKNVLHSFLNGINTDIHAEIRAGHME